MLLHMNCRHKQQFQLAWYSRLGVPYTTSSYEYGACCLTGSGAGCRGHSSGSRPLCMPAALLPSTPWQWIAPKLWRVQPMTWNQVQAPSHCIENHCGHRHHKLPAQVPDRLAHACQLCLPTCKLDKLDTWEGCVLKRDVAVFGVQHADH